jgi:hypothetical protein
MNELRKVMYTAEATVEGGREGRSRTDVPAPTRARPAATSR